MLGNIISFPLLLIITIRLTNYVLKYTFFFNLFFFFYAVYSENMKERKSSEMKYKFI